MFRTTRLAFRALAANLIDALHVFSRVRFAHLLEEFLLIGWVFAAAIFGKMPIKQRVDCGSLTFADFHAAHRALKLAETVLRSSLGVLSARGNALLLLGLSFLPSAFGALGAFGLFFRLGILRGDYGQGECESSDCCKALNT